MAEAGGPSSASSAFVGGAGSGARNLIQAPRRRIAPRRIILPPLPLDTAFPLILRRRNSVSNGRLPALTTALSWGPLIPATSLWGNWAALVGLASLSQRWGRTTTVGRLLGAPVTAMALAFLCASVGLLNPGGTEAARCLQLLSLQLATPLILLGADLRWSSLARCGPLLLSFWTASTATFIASWVGWQCVAGSALSKALVSSGGELDGLKIAAALLAKNIGGGVNYIAVATSLGASASAVSAGLCVDNLFALLYFPATSALAKGREDVATIGANAEKTSQETNNLIESTATPPITIQTITLVLFLAAALLWLGEVLGGPSGALPVCTILTVLMAGLAPAEMIKPLRPTADTLGLVALYVFFATAGAPGMLVADSVRSSLLPLAAFLACLYSLHGAMLWIAYKLVGPTRFRGAFGVQRLLVASSAAIGGPATAVALTSTAQWPSLTVPSLLVGNVGYAIATFCGLAFYRMLVP